MKALEETTAFAERSDLKDQPARWELVELLVKLDPWDLEENVESTDRRANEDLLELTGRTVPPVSLDQWDPRDPEVIMESVERWDRWDRKDILAPKACQDTLVKRDPKDQKGSQV